MVIFSGITKTYHLCLTLLHLQTVGSRHNLVVIFSGITKTYLSLSNFVTSTDSGFRHI